MEVLLNLPSPVAAGFTASLQLWGNVKSCYLGQCVHNFSTAILTYCGMIKVFLNPPTPRCNMSGMARAPLLQSI